MIQVTSVEAFAFRAPLDKPVKVAFGDFRDRPMVLVRIIDADGTEGWGEIWSNWPATGAEHRARLAMDIGQALLGQEFSAPGDAFASLTSATEVLVLQSGEVGPISQVIAGIDIALWDITARQQGMPLYRCLSDKPVDFVPVYLTGLNPDLPEITAAQRQAEGHNAFKLKIGFGKALDLRNLEALRQTLGDEVTLMVDANQSYDFETASKMARLVEGFNPIWFEEAMRVDAPRDQWRALADASPIALAGGENLRGDQFHSAIANGILKVLQPDITKWGGVSENLPIAKAALAAGCGFCPHFFGGGIALISSLHLLAAAGGDGLLEFDEHPNAGRELIIGDMLPITEGTVPVPQGPGLGVSPSLQTLRRYQTWPA